MNQPPITRRPIVDSDVALIQLWVRQKASKQRRADWLLAKQFLQVCGKPLGAIAVEDLHRYVQFLMARRQRPEIISQKAIAVRSLFDFGYQIGYLSQILPAESWPTVEGRSRSRQQRRRRTLAATIAVTLCTLVLGATIQALPSQEAPPEVTEKEVREWGKHVLPRDDRHDPERISALKVAYIKAFLDMLAWAEGTEGPNAYRMQFTGTTFESFEDHPREIKCGWRHGRQLCSDAAGRYQFLSTSWDRMARKIGARDFSPENQDRAAIAMLEEYEVLEDIEAGWFDMAALELIPVWPSLLDVGNGDRRRAIARLKTVYRQRLQKYRQGL
ncbi:glycoside hydrolase family 24 protein [Oxynema aestuarii]|uniref:Glycoside hydrolase family 104 protein n=1 Tax=Oxynema aestuarii AP17 TaxID=2064643 RepID=A0A6H1U2E7_9CYAN|nr:glycoside hydrolase family 104 protein [Oxynema aestuarii]QIZ72340.1 glycoside hydrolase family 104 protein [Oxynema aestuarii AP17]